MLLTERWTRFLRRDAADDPDDPPPSPAARCGGRRARSPAASWPATSKALDEDLGRVRGLPVDRQVDADPPAVEILSLH